MIAFRSMLPLAVLALVLLQGCGGKREATGLVLEAGDGIAADGSVVIWDNDSVAQDWIHDRAPTWIRVVIRKPVHPDLLLRVMRLANEYNARRGVQTEVALAQR